MSICCSSRTIICASVLASLLTIAFFATNYQQVYHLAANYRQHSNNSSHHDSSTTAKDAFVEKWLNTQMNDPFNISAISNLCRNRKPRNDIIVKCAPGTGGVGNIRSYMLHCVRFAMETGGSIILPRFRRRAQHDIADIYGGELQDFEFFFDRAWFKETLEEACPHITVHEVMDKEWEVVGKIPHFGGGIDESTIDVPSPWRREFDRWVFEMLSRNAEPPWVVESSDPGREKHVRDDGVEFFRNFGRLLLFRPDVRRLAAVATTEMSDRFGLHVDPEQDLFENAYLGAHVRTARDAVKAGWKPNFEKQTNNYMRQAKEASMKVIYAAGGNHEDLVRFAIKAESEGLSVVSKHNLLSGNDLRELNNLGWDQKALLDFEMLLRSTTFGGFARSSFSHNIAYRRHFLSVVEDPFNDPHDMFADELSRVYESFDARWQAEGRRTMWP